MITRPSKEILDKHNSYYKYDTAFSAHARLLQSLWRERMKYPIGKLGNYLTNKIKTLIQHQQTHGWHIKRRRIK